MYPKEHIILGLIFSALIWIIFSQISFHAILIIFLSSVLIDIDHYMVYVLRKRDFSLKNAYNWHEILRKEYKIKIKKNPKLKMPFHLFHTIEFLIFIFALSFYYNFFLWVFIGFSFHSFLDMFDMAFRKVFNSREYSLIMYLVSDKKNYI